MPRFDEQRLDAITNAEVAKLKAELVDRSPKMSRIQRLAGLKVTGSIHILRHTFCSRLALRRRPSRNWPSTRTSPQRHMHRSPTAGLGAVRTLERRSKRHK
ncbi:hypothetical protein [Corallococcus sp. AB049A]|uniref:hypothetical protein n=1 Tax=Corallococcus sp. AB049A TaxID=2316721 RepID=UPI0011C375C2|nr:hypothetical protein [Corallococcus sp. AB049A]